MSRSNLSSIKHSTSKVSVIIVNWNGEKWLKKCLDSFTNQTYKNIEIIMVDNGSTDSSVNFVKNAYHHVIVIESDTNLGFAGGNNLGINHSSGDYILLANNDSWAENNLISHLLDFMVKSKIDVVAPYEVTYESDAITSPYKIQLDVVGHPKYIKDLSKIDQINEFYLSGVCLLFSKKLYKNTGGLDNDFFMYFEEIDWFWRLHLYGKTIAHDRDTVIHHAGAGSTGAGIKYKSFLWRNQNDLQMLLKNYSFIMLVLVLPIYLAINILESIFFFIIMKWDIASTYPLGWIFNIKNIKRTLAKRKHIQRQRQVSDWVIIKRMYIGIAKFSHLTSYALKKVKVKVSA